MSYPLSRPSFARAVAAAPQARAAELLASYPDLAKPQLDELIAMFPRLSALDLALMMSDDQVGPRLEAFCATHRERLGPSLADYAVIAAILCLPVMVLLSVVASGS